MKKEQLYEIIGEIRDDYIQQSLHPETKMQRQWHNGGALAFALAAVLLIGFFALHTILDSGNLPLSESTESMEETAFGTRYVYQIDRGTFAPYKGGKVIEEGRIGKKLEDVTVIAGWITEPTQSPADETLRGEVYEIKGVSPDIAAALWFLDKGDALTTTHYYVILNPTADLTPVTDYVIPDYLPNPMEE